MSICAVIACTALAATNEVAVGAVETNAAAANSVAEAKIVQIVPFVPSAATSGATSGAEDWADELAERGEEGVFAVEGNILVVAIAAEEEGESPVLSKLRAKFRAVELLRGAYPALPAGFSAPCRVLLNSVAGDGRNLCVVLFNGPIQ